MARRIAKRANRQNPREDRGFDDGKFNKGRRGNQRVTSGETPTATNFSFEPKKKKIDIIPRNLNQEELYEMLCDPGKFIVFATGPAGCGKTYIATLFALKELKAGNIKKIVITRPNVAVDDKDIGFLPGDIHKKMMPWMMPIMDVFAEYYSQKEIATMLEENVIEVVPIAYIRGRTFKDAIVLVDEAQGTTINSMKSILTRIGDNCRMVVTGDIRQSDRGADNGLADFLTRLSNARPDGISVVRFGHKDIERHQVIEEVLRMYGEE